MNSTARRFLVVVRAGTKSLHPQWLGPAGLERNWDLLLSAYGENTDALVHGDLPTLVDRGTKWDSMARLFRSQPDLLERYEYVMLADDDLLMKGEDINRLFELSAAQGLSLSQFALSRDSWITYPALMHCPGYRLRYTNHIDCMAPCIASGYLKTLLPFIEKYSCGWGADHTWALMMDDPAYRSAVVDEMTMVHTRKFATGSLHRTFAALGADPHEEVRTVLGLFENFPGSNINYAALLPDGRRVGSTHVQLRNAVHLMCSAPWTHTPYKVFRKGIGMLVQVFTRAGHLPEKLRYIDTAAPRAAEVPSAGIGDAPPTGMAGLST